MERKIYLVYTGKKSKLVTNKQDAIGLAKREGAQIRQYPLKAYNEGNKPRRGEFTGWDFPTLHMLSEPLEIKKKKGTFAKKRVAKKSCKRRK